MFLLEFVEGDFKDVITSYYSNYSINESVRNHYIRTFGFPSLVC
jgi:hypothetical protein